MIHFKTSVMLDLVRTKCITTLYFKVVFESRVTAEIRNQIDLLVKQLISGMKSSKEKTYSPTFLSHLKTALELGAPPSSFIAEAQHKCSI